MTLVVDRTTCTGKGVCVYLLDGALTRDEWGYPIVVDTDTIPGRAAVSVAISLCPVGALQWVDSSGRESSGRKMRDDTTGKGK